MALLAYSFDTGYAEKLDNIYLKIVNISFNSYNTQVLIDMQAWLTKESREQAKKVDEIELRLKLGKKENQTDEEWIEFENNAKIMYRPQPLATWQTGCRAVDIDVHSIDLLDPNSMLSSAYQYLKDNFKPEIHNFKDV